MNLDKLKEAARKYEQSGQWRPAIEVYKKALREFEETGEGVPDPSLYNRVGDLEMKDGESGAAIRAYEQAADLYTEQGFFNNAIALCGKILRINPSRSSTYLRLAQLNARKTFVGEARKNLLEYVERMEALHHREEAFAALRAYADQFAGNAEVRSMLIELLRDASQEREAREQLARLAEEIEARGDTGGPRRTRERIVTIEGESRPVVRPGGSSDLVFLDLGIPGLERGGQISTLGNSASVPGLELPTDTDSEVDWRRDADSLDQLGLVRTDLDAGDAIDLTGGEDDAPATVVGEGQEDIDAFPRVDGGRAVDGLSLVNDELSPETADGEGRAPVAETFETLDAAAQAAPDDPEGRDLVFLPVDQGESARASPAAPTSEDPAVLARDRGRLLLEIGDRAAGISALEEALAAFEASDRLEDALQTAEDLTRLEPDAVFRFQKRVELAYRSGHREVMLDAYLQLADALLRGGGLEHALTVYRRVLEHDPGNARARSAIAMLTEPEPVSPASPQESFVDLGSLILDEPSVRDTRMRVDQAAPIEDEDEAFHEALAQFKRGIEENLDAEDSQAHYDLGIAFKEMGLLDEAIAQFQKALRTPEGRLRTSEQLGIAFFEKGRYAIAEAVLRRAIESLPGGDEEKIGLVYWLGRSMEAQRRNEEAVRCYERALAVDIRFLDVSERMHRLIAESR